MGHSLGQLAQKRVKEWTRGGTERPDLLHDGLQVLDSSAQFGIGAFFFAVHDEGFDGLGKPLKAIGLSFSDLDDARDELLICRRGIIFGGVEEQDRHSAEASAIQFAARMLPLNTPPLTVHRDDENHYDLAPLVGKRFVCASEIEVGKRLAENKIKSITGGDAITCRGLYQNFFTYQPQFKLWLATNNLPRVAGTDVAIWRRIHVVRFPFTIPEAERDGSLGDRLVQELPGILNWALFGLAEWQRRGLSPPDAVRKETEQYKEQSDSVEQFIGCCCLKNPAAKTSTKQLYDRYNSWCEQSGIDPVPKQVFGKNLRQKAYTPFKANTGNGWKGLILIP